MGRPIDADALYTSYCNLYEGNVPDAELDRVAHAIASAPTIDPESLRPRGRWEPILDSVWNLPNPVLSGWRYSECGRTEDNKEPYCNCGAKMEAEME